MPSPVSAAGDKEGAESCREHPYSGGGEGCLNGARASGCWEAARRRSAGLPFRDVCTE